MVRCGREKMLGFFLAVAACGGEPMDPPPPPPPPPPAPLDCSGVAPVQLGVGEHAVVDPAQTGGCVRVPEAGAGGAEYIVVAASTAENRTEFGVSGAYHLRTAAAGATAAPPATHVADAPAEPRRPTAAQAFHDMLRRREAELAADPRTRITSAPPAASVPPLVGHVRTFKVCAAIDCSAFADVMATARHVGAHAAIYMDNDVPTADPLQEADFEELSDTFDTWLYPFNAANFGTESDIDANERIVILMTDAVNALTPDCTNGRVLGYFFGLDLAGGTNSNQSEVFYTFVPAPETPLCNEISRETAVNSLKPTLVHELQHMISWAERVIRRFGGSEQLWLNEALSHFAEELAGRQIPAAECMAAGFSSCRSQYISSNIINAYDYLEDTEATFLVAPVSSSGTLTERGASWLFLRWVIDQFAADSILGPAFTRGLVQTTTAGASNIVANTGETFARMVVEWLLASYLDDRDGFTGVSPRLRFKSWGLRSIYEDMRNAQIFPNGFPLRPESTSGSYSRSGLLRGGSGRHLLLTQQANGNGIDVQLVRNTNGDPIEATLLARIGIARIR